MIAKQFAQRRMMRMADQSGALDGVDLGLRGLAVGTLVATMTGWRKVETIRAGESIPTFDNGPQKVLAATRGMLRTSGDSACWPLAVPERVLGNGQPMILAPRQDVVIESDLAEMLHGDPFAVVAASVLEGIRGITPVPPNAGIEVTVLRFAQEEVIFGGRGALLHCPARADLAARSGSADQSRSPRLTDAQARGVVEALPPITAEPPLPAERAA